MNQVVLIGNIGHDPEVISFDNGGKLAKLSIATTEYWLNENRERQAYTTWHQLQITKKGLIGVIEKWVKKGSKIAVTGQYLNRHYKPLGS